MDVESPIPDDLGNEVAEEERPVLEATQVSAFYAGPLPPPQMLEKYEAVVPGLAGKIVDWTEAETQHRRGLERDQQNEQIRILGRAQFFGVGVALFGIAVGGAIVAFSPGFATATVASVMVICAIGGPFAARRLAERWDKRDQGQEEKDSNERPAS